MSIAKEIIYFIAITIFLILLVEFFILDKLCLYLYYAIKVFAENIGFYAKFNARLWMRDGESDGKDCIIC